jgi:hypothetical protein
VLLFDGIKALIRMFRPVVLVLFAAATGAAVPGQPFRIRASPGNDVWQPLEARARQFETAGCTCGRLTREEVKGRKESNIVCTLPGTSEETIVI